jgi:hypothetical protein
MHHTDPAAPGHQSTSNGLLPAFNANTKPLKSRALDRLLRVGILSDARHRPRRDHPYRLNFRAAWQSRQVGLWSIQGRRHHALIQLKYPVPERPWLAGGGLQGVAN